MIFPMWGYVAIGSLVVGFGAGWQVNEWRHNSKELHAVKKADKKTDQQRAVIHGEATNYENDREAGRVEAVDREGRIREVFRTVEVPGTCAAPEPVRVLLDNAVRSANDRAGSESSAGLPAATVPAKPVD